MKGDWDVEIVTILVALLLVVLWIFTHYIGAVFNIGFDKSFLAQLGNMAMLALGVLGISKVAKSGKKHSDKNLSDTEETKKPKNK